jgi:hypothetical protein
MYKGVQGLQGITTEDESEMHDGPLSSLQETPGAGERFPGTPV